MITQKIAVITGGNKGIGLETARQLALLGIHVFIGARDVEKGEIAASQLKAQNLSAESLVLDVTMSKVLPTLQTPSPSASDTSTFSSTMPG